MRGKKERENNKMMETPNSRSICKLHFSTHSYQVMSSVIFRSFKSLFTIPPINFGSTSPSSYIFFLMKAPLIISAFTNQIWPYHLNKCSLIFSQTFWRNLISNILMFYPNSNLVWRHVSFTFSSQLRSKDSNTGIWVH